MKATPAYWTGLFLLAFDCPSLAAPLCMGKPQTPSAEITRAEPGETLSLADGRTVKLEGIRVAPQSSEALRRLTVARTASFHATDPKQDRYGRLRAQVFFPDGAWLQHVLLERGMARVDMAPDKSDCAFELFAAEAKARAAQAGLWKLPSNVIRSTTLAKADTGTFQIVEGTVLNVDIRNGRAYLNFGTDYKTDFTVTISPEDRKAFWAKVSPRDYLGKTLRIRGIIQYYNGPELEVAAPHQIEIVQ